MGVLLILGLRLLRLDGRDWQCNGVVEEKSTGGRRVQFT
jgi:hypothetical protein